MPWNLINLIWNPHTWNIKKQTLHFKLPLQYVRMNKHFYTVEYLLFQLLTSASNIRGHGVWRAGSIRWHPRQKRRKSCRNRPTKDRSVEENQAMKAVYWFLFFSRPKLSLQLRKHYKWCNCSNNHRLSLQIWFQPMLPVGWKFWW